MASNSIQSILRWGDNQEKLSGQKMGSGSEKADGATEVVGTSSQEARIAELEARVDSLMRALTVTEPDQLKDLLDLLPHYVFAKDWNGRFILANKACARLYDKTVDELIGCLHSDLHDDPDEVALMLADDREVMTSGGRLVREESNVDARGQRHVFQKVKVAFRLPGDRLPAVFGIATEIAGSGSSGDASGTQQDSDELQSLRVSLDQSRKDLAERDEEIRGLRLELEQSEALHKAKDSFMTKVSHEIRTPMTSIVGFAEQLLNEAQSLELPRDQQDSLHIIQQNSEHLLAVLNDLMNSPVSSIDPPVVSSSEVNVPRLLGQVVSLMHRQAAAKQIGFQLETLGPIPERISSDITRIRQVLINLIGNAITYTDQGQVTVRVRCLDPSSENPQLRFDVIDTGRGLSQELQDTLFQRFANADAGILAGGHHGLGLIISKKLARLLGGDLIIRSREGKGSTFSFVIGTGRLEGVKLLTETVAEGFSLLEPEPAMNRPLPQLDGHILLVEDVEVNRSLISGILARAGARVISVVNGADACDLVEAEAHRGDPFELIFMDMQMPVMDGYEATRHLRSQGFTVPIVALTAHSMTGDEEKCLSAGCDYYLAKPIKRRELLELAASCLEGDEPSA